MLSGYRLLVIALGLALAGTAPAPNKAGEPHQQPAAAPAQRSLERIADAESKQAEPGEYQAPCADDEYNNKSDLCAQWYAARSARDAADWTYWAVFWTVVSLALSAFGLIALLITIRQGREANKISRDASRAWLSIVVSETGKFWLRAGNLEFRFDVILENHGGSPGLNAFCKGFIVLGSPRDFKLPSLDKIAPSKSTDAECVFFPNSKPTGTEIIAELEGQFPERSEINLVVACRYKIAGHDDWRGSTRTFQLRQDVELYVSSGRFRNGVCEMRIAENAGETIELHLKERNDCPPTAT